MRGTSGKRLMQAAVPARLEGIAADCGGSMTCTTCHVIVEPARAVRLPPPDEEEDSMLDATAVPRPPTRRLI